VKRTSTITNNSNPFFGEEFTFDPILAEDDLYMTIAAFSDSPNASSGSKPSTILGQTSLTKTFLMESTDTSGGERWFVLQPMSSGKGVSLGELTVRVRYDGGCGPEEDCHQVTIESVFFYYLFFHENLANKLNYVRLII
jgi:hypothetical protein